MRVKKILPLAIVALLSWSGTTLAQYTIVLKNGGRITVDSYWEDAGMVRFYGMGGEIGMAKDEIKTILKPGEKEERGMVVPGMESVGAVAPEAKPEEEKEGVAPKAPAEAKPEGKTLSPEQKQAEERAKQEQEYQKRVRELTMQLKSARDRYLTATRGSASTNPTLLEGQQAIEARTQDLISRLRDAQHNPAGPSDAGGVTLSTPPAFSGTPPTTTELRPGAVAPRVDAPLPGYSDKQRELSDLRNQIYQLEKERDKLIEEMRQKNFGTGALFLD